MKSIVFCVLYNLFLGTASAETFTVALPMLPDVNPITNQINAGNYIGSHLYYPLFERNENSFDSFFLDIKQTKALDTKFSKFKFCLKAEVKFSDNAPVQVSDLISSIKKMSAMYPQTIPVSAIQKENDRCIVIDLKESSVGLFSKLTGMASTILKEKELNSAFPTGAGPYMISNKMESEIELKSTSAKKPRFDVIVFKLVRKSDENVSGFKDINQLPPNAERDKTFVGQKIEVPSLKVYSFVLNVQDSKLRDSIRSKLEKVDWAQVFGLSLVKSNYFLPWLNSKYEIKNTQLKIKLENKITFIVPEFYDASKVQDAVRSSGLGEILDVKSLPAIKFAEWAFSGKQYVGLMGFDSSGSISSLEGDFSVYFESFFSDSNRIFTNSLLPVKEAIKLASSKSLTSLERLKHISSAEQYLSDNDFLHPIGRVNRVFLYPSDIKIKKWHDFFSGIPMVDSIQ